MKEVKEVIEELAETSVESKEGLLGSKKFLFARKIARKTREDIEKQLKQKKYKVVWGDNCVLVRS